MNNPKFRFNNEVACWFAAVIILIDVTFLGWLAFGIWEMKKDIQKQNLVIQDKSDQMIIDVGRGITICLTRIGDELHVIAEGGSQPPYLKMHDNQNEAYLEGVFSET
jgi:hypothetical protein